MILHYILDKNILKFIYSKPVVSEKCMVLQGVFCPLEEWCFDSFTVTECRKLC